MWDTQRTDVGAFGVWSGSCHQAGSADLAGVVVEPFDRPLDGAPEGFKAFHPDLINPPRFS
jgi:hypothetical protein